jgi:hypothetical protein
VLQKTGNIAAVMSTMGHSDVKTAMMYQQSQMNIVREAINAQGISGHVLVRRPEIGITAKRDHPAILSSAVPDALNDRLTCIEGAPLFYRLSTAEWTSILSIARERRFSSQKVIFGEGDPACCIFVHASGPREANPTQPVGRMK